MNKPFRIILIIFILELFVVASLGFVFQNKLQTVEDQIASGQITSMEQVRNNYEELKYYINARYVNFCSNYYNTFNIFIKNGNISFKENDRKQRKESNCRRC